MQNKLAAIGLAFITVFLTAMGPSNPYPVVTATPTPTPTPFPICSAPPTSDEAIKIEFDFDGKAYSSDGLVYPDLMDIWGHTFFEGIIFKTITWEEIDTLIASISTNDPNANVNIGATVQTNSQGGMTSESFNTKITTADDNTFGFTIGSNQNGYDFGIAYINDQNSFDIKFVENNKEVDFTLKLTGIQIAGGLSPTSSVPLHGSAVYQFPIVVNTLGCAIVDGKLTPILSSSIGPYSILTTTGGINFNFTYIPGSTKTSP